MHPPRLREQAVRMMDSGIPFGEICRALGLPRGTVGHWFYGERARRHREAPPGRTRCARCRPVPGLPDDARAYAYLLGLYLGDGHLVTRAKVPALRVYCADAWPGLIGECEKAMLAVLAKGVQRVHHRDASGCRAIHDIGRACFPSTGRDTNTIDPSAWPNGSGR
jgi:hypothetical protein